VGILLSVASTLLSVLVAARRQTVGRARWSWLLVAIGLVSVCVGIGYGIWHDVSIGDPPSTPSWSDLAYLLSYPTVAFSLVVRPIQRARDINRWLLILDVGVMLCAIVAVSWVLVLGPLFDRFTTNPLTQAVTIAYPIADIGIMLCLAVLLLRETRGRLSTILLIVGAGAIATADAMSVALTVSGSYHPGDPIDAVWFAGMVLIGLGAAVDPPLKMVAQTDLYIGWRWQFITPAGLIVLMGAFVWLGPLLDAGTWPETSHVALALGIALMLTRYVMSYRDTVQAHDLLAQQAADREVAQAAREEAARLEGVLLTARELTHLLNNDLAIVVGNVEMLGLRPGLSADEQSIIGDAEGGLQRVALHLRQLQQVSRVKTRETPVGPALDLEGSTVPATARRR
jgi:signal transduction histidine kinase